MFCKYKAEEYPYENEYFYVLAGEKRKRVLVETV